MTHMTPRGQIISRNVGLGVVITAVLARSFAVLYWADVHFDADQAVTGLMAKHVAEGRAFPVFQYAQAYVLVLEAWLAAPLVAIANSSIVLLKCVPVALNVATAALLYSMLTTGAALSPAAALLATAPVALPGPNAVDELTSALGMNIEPLLFALILWLLRERPIALGITAAVAVKNREFALYALAALVAVDLLRDRSATLWRGRIVGFVAFALTWSIIGLLSQHSSPLGPGTDFSMMGGGGDNMSVATSALCIEPDLIPRDAWILATELLPFQFGVSSTRWLTGGMSGAQPPDATWLWVPLVTVLMFGASRGLARAWRQGPTALTWLGMYLVLIGLQAVFVYATTRCGHVSLFTLRYTLLSLFIPAGAVALSLERESRSSVRALVIGICSLWVGVCALGHLTIVRGFIASPPLGTYRQLATYLDANGVRFIVSDYWIGYHVAFLTGERIKALTDFPRIHDYSLAVGANLNEAVEVRRLQDERCENAVVVASFYVCPPRPAPP